MKSATSLFKHALGLVAVMFLMAVPTKAQTVTSNGQTISDGAAAVSLVDGTDLGDKLVQLETSSSTFRYINNTAGAITVTDISFDGAGDLTEEGLTISFLPALPLMMPPGANVDITVTFDPQDGGLHDGDLKVTSDAAIMVYNFLVSGDGFLDYGDNVTEGLLAVNGARHVVTGIKLGSLRDSESDAGATDDGVGADDEDGVTVPSDFVAGGEASLVLEVSAAGFASAFLDKDAGGDFDEILFADQAVVAGTNVISFTVPAVTAGTQRARVRVCSAIDLCDTALGLATDGEVEDFPVVAKTGGNLTVDFSMPGAAASVDLVGTDLVITDGSANVLFSAPLADVDELNITGDASDESVSVDPDAVPAASGMDVDLGLGTDSMTIKAGAATAGFVTHAFTNANDGNVWVDAANIRYTGLDPITDLVVAGHRTFTFNGGAETITMSTDGDGASGNGTTFIDSDAGESVSFVNPTLSLTINGGTGADVMSISELDAPVDAGFATLTVNGDAGADDVTIAPSADYVISTDGGADTDVLSFDLSNGASIDVFDHVGGSVTFTSGHNPISFINYEAYGNADLSIALNKSTIYAGDDLAGNTVLTITVTNNGPAKAFDAAVDLGDLLTDNQIAGPTNTLTATPSQGTLASLGMIAVGASVTIDITGFVVNHNPATYDITVTYAGDPNDGNNVATLASEPGFAFPAKTHVNAAIFVTESTTIGGTATDPYDKLVVGLFQGSPGIEGAVWCKIPHPIVTVGAGATLFPEEIGGSTDYFGDRWRPCSKGLPFPLHVNDIFRDQNDDLWLMTWGSAGLYKSEDEGESWTAAAPDATCTTIPTNCLANGNGGNGAWTNVYAMTQDQDGFLYISVNDGYVFRSLNDGDSWQQVGSLPNVDADTPWSLHAHPANNGVLYAGTFGRGVYVSTDYGFNWALLDNDDTDGIYQTLLDANAGHIFDIEFSEDDDDMIFVATGKGVYRLVLDGTSSLGDAGEDWEFLGVEVTLDDASVVRPEIRSLAFVPSAGDDDLLVTTWGFGAYAETAPTTGPAGFAQFALRGQQVGFVVAGENGSIFMGTASGDNLLMNASDLSASSTANENEISTELPDGYALGQNYPNPFNPVTTIQFALPESGNVRLAVYDVLGREVAVLVDGALTAGQHDVQFNAAGLTSGTYIYRLSTDKGSFTKQLSLLK